MRLMDEHRMRHGRLPATPQARVDSPSSMMDLKRQVSDCVRAGGGKHMSPRAVGRGAGAGSPCLRTFYRNTMP